MMKWIFSLFLSLLWTFNIFAGDKFDFLSYFQNVETEKIFSKKYALQYEGLEREFYVLTNLARMYPLEFEKMLVDYVKQSDVYKNGNPYVLSLRKDLNKLKPLTDPLRPHNTLDQLALSHAQYGARTQKTGHQNFQKRYNTVQQKMKHLTYAENCSYNYPTAIDLFMSLLIDDQIKDVGHRKNIFNKKLTHIGISILPFTRDGYVAVQIFSAE